MAHCEEVIIVRTNRGSGEDQKTICSQVTQVFQKDGTLVAEHDGALQILLDKTHDKAEALLQAIGEIEDLRPGDIVMPLREVISFIEAVDNRIGKS